MAKKIPTPSAQQLQAAGRERSLVLIYNIKQNKWELLGKAQAEKVKSNGPSLYVTYDEFQSGTTQVPEPSKPNTQPSTKDSSKPTVGGVAGRVDDKTLVDSSIASASITIGPSGPVVNYGFPNPQNDNKPETYEAYLYVDDRGNVSTSPDEARAGITVSKEFTFYRTDQARDKHLNDLYKIFGSKQAIIDRLYNAGYLNTKKDVPTDAMLAALDAAAAQYTVDQVEGYKSKQITEFQTLAQWLGQRQDRAPESLAGTRTSRNITEFSDTDARFVIDDVVSALLQRLPSEQEYAKLVPLIQKKQRQNPQITATTTDEKGRVVATKTKTGINERQFLIEKLSKKDEAKANQIMSYYDAFKQAIGVQ